MTIASLASSAWVASNAAGYWRYRRALVRPADTQAALLRRYLSANARSRFGIAHGFSAIRSVEEYQVRVPLMSYADVADAVEAIARAKPQVLTCEPVRTLALSSGSASAAKRIPYTRTLQREFRRAIAPWIVDLYRNKPSLAGGCSYWSITPVATNGSGSPEEPRPQGGGEVTVGFEEDTDYLGAIWKPLVDRTLAVPGVVRFIDNIETFRYVTLLFLLRRADLRLVSIWHPSFLTLLLGALPSHWGSLLHDIRHGTLTVPSALPAEIEAPLRAELEPDPLRAGQLQAIGPRDCAAIWPSLGLVSCWADGHAATGIGALKAALPQARLQPKGLLATEGVVTLPFAGKTPLAIRSHFFEFLHDGRAWLAHQLEAGKVYSIVLTTGGGLYRYRLEDTVQVDGFVAGTPSLRFLGKEDHVSDLCGEKLNETFTAGALAQACASAGVLPRFALLAPDAAVHPPAYTLYLESDAPPPAALGVRLDARLSENPHYRYCRALGQLAPLRVFYSSAPLFPRYLARCRELGQRAGDVKALSLSARCDWSEVFGSLPERTGCES